MRKIYKFLLVIIVTFVVSSCSCSKEDLICDNEQLVEENEKLKEKIKNYDGVKELFEFYNKITTININSFLLVESKRVFNSNSFYSDGVIVASNGPSYYVLTDYNRLKQEGIVEYRVRDCNANVYSAKLAKLNGEVLYDEYTGLILLEVNGVYGTSNKPITFGDISEIVAHISSLGQLNKVQLTQKIKTSAIEYNDASYVGYYLEDITTSSGMLVNQDNKLLAIYSSKLNLYVDGILIKKLVNSIYSLNL